MQALIVIALMVATAICAPHAANADEQGDVAAIESLFTRYVQLWNEGNMDSIGAQIYAAPVLSVRPNGTHIAIPTGEALAQIFKKAYLDYLTKTGVQRWEIEKPNVCLLGNDIAMAVLVWFGRRANVETAQRLGFLYFLQKTNGEWRIIMSSPRTLATRITCEG